LDGWQVNFGEIDREPMKLETIHYLFDYHVKHILLSMFNCLIKQTLLHRLESINNTRRKFLV